MCYKCGKGGRAGCGCCGWQSFDQKDKTFSGVERLVEERGCVINPVYDLGAVDRPVGDAVSQSVERGVARIEGVVACGLIRIEEEERGSQYIQQQGDQHGREVHAVQPGARQRGVGQMYGNVELVPRATQVLKEIGEGRFYILRWRV